MLWNPENSAQVLTWAPFEARKNELRDVRDLLFEAGPELVTVLRKEICALPPAKKPVTRRSSGRGSVRTTRRQSSRAQVERATKRFEKALDEASSALQALAKDAGTGARQAYGDVNKALRAIQRDAKRTNTKLLKDLEKLAGASRTATGRPTAPRKRSTGTAAKRSKGAKRATPRGTGTRSAGRPSPGPSVTSDGA